ncbi:type III polyketide synthase [Streptomyces sp. NPDC099088]|uniref:type III polyketide synthase n=1 Tax=Streptomyces sp. NPDC099088 TaxID=3366101 RepID=UPI00381CAE7E
MIRPPVLSAIFVEFPDNRYAQCDLVTSVAQASGLSPSSIRRLVQFSKDSGVEARHLALPVEAYRHLTDIGRANDFFLEAGMQLGEKAILGALGQAGVDASAIDMVITTSSTGIAVPSLDACLAERVGFRSDIKRIPMFGLGCAGGAAGVARLNDYLLAWPDSAALLLTVELNTLTVGPNRDSVASQAFSSLFGDAVGAVIALGSNHPCADRSGRARVLATKSRLYPERADLSGVRVGASGMEVKISPDVGEFVLRELRPAVESFLAENNHTMSDVLSWFVNPAGYGVIDAMGRALDLEPSVLDHSRDSWAQAGATSATSIIDVLRRGLSSPQPQGSLGLMISSGPGFSFEMVLLLQ